MSPIKEEAVSIARRLLHTSQGDWLSRIRKVAICSPRSAWPSPRS